MGLWVRIWAEAYTGFTDILQQWIPTGEHFQLPLTDNEIRGQVLLPIFLFLFYSFHYVILTQKLCTVRPCPASILMRPALGKWRWGWRVCLYCLRRLWFLPWRVEAINTEIKLTGRRATSCPLEQSARQQAEVDVYIIISHLYWSLARPIV